MAWTQTDKNTAHVGRQSNECDVYDELEEKIRSMGYSYTSKNEMNCAEYGGNTSRRRYFGGLPSYFATQYLYRWPVAAKEATIYLLYKTCSP
jgi:hypothetical protein